jgi:hypothetical protein
METFLLFRYTATIFRPVWSMAFVALGLQSILRRVAASAVDLVRGIMIMTRKHHGAILG